MPLAALLDLDVGVDAEVSSAAVRHFEGDSQHECIQSDDLPASRTLDSREDLVQGCFMEIPDVLAELVLPVVEVGHVLVDHDEPRDFLSPLNLDQRFLGARPLEVQVDLVLERFDKQCDITL